MQDQYQYQQLPGPEHAVVAKPVMSTGAQDYTALDATGKYVVKYQGAFAAVEVRVTANDTLKAQGGAMVTLTHNVDINAKMEGGLGGALCLGCCTNESFFFSHFGLKPGMGDRGDVLLAPGVPGEILLLHMDGTTQWAIQKGAFLGADSSVDIGTMVQGFTKGCCSGLGFVIMRASGVGRLLLASYGALIRYDVQAGEVRTIDNGFVVAWTSDMNYEVGLAASTLGNSLLSGEGFVTRFTGPGTIYVQTRSIKSLAGALRPYLPAGGGGGG